MQTLIRSLHHVTQYAYVAHPYVRPDLTEAFRILLARS